MKIVTSGTIFHKLFPKKKQNRNKVFGFFFDESKYTIIYLLHKKATSKIWCSITHLQKLFDKNLGYIGPFGRFLANPNVIFGH